MGENWERAPIKDQKNILEVDRKVFPGEKRKGFPGENQKYLLVEKS